MNRGKILNFVLKSNFLFFCTSSQVFKSNFNQVVSRFDFKNIIQIANGKGSTLLILTVKELIVFDVMLELIVSRLQLELPFISMEYSEKLYLCTLLQVHVAVDLNQPYSTDLKLETRLVWESKMEIKSLKLSFNSIYLQHLKMVTVFDISTRKMDLISHSDLVTAMTIINGYSGHIRSQGGQSDESASGDGYSREKENLILGDERGCISILHGRKRVRLHWHANPVGALACTNDGSYLLSGGQESTLVMWQLQTGFKQFLPRLGGFILDIQISSDDLHYVLYLSDNSLLIIDAVDTNIRHSIQNTEACMVDISEYPMSIGLQQDHFKNYCVNGSASRLQLFDSKSLEPVQTVYNFDLDGSWEQKCGYYKQENNETESYY